MHSVMVWQKYKVVYLLSHFYAQEHLLTDELLSQPKSLLTQQGLFCLFLAMTVLVIQLIPSAYSCFPGTRDLPAVMDLPQFLCTNI